VCAEAYDDSAPTGPRQRQMRAFQTQSRHPGLVSCTQRVVMVYVPGALATEFVAYFIGDRYGSSGCTVNSMDCDLGTFYGLAWAVAALYVWIVVSIIAEVFVRHPGRTSSLD
jgi:hypothetical protein